MATTESSLHAVGTALRNILVATDFSTCSDAALRCAAGLARAHNGNVTLLHVISLEPAYPVAVEPLPPELLEEANGVGARMDDVMAKPQLRGIPHRALIYRGDLPLILDQVVAEKQIDLIVLGTHGREGMQKLLIGSVAEQVLRHATCPVLTVGPHVDLDYVDEGRYPRVLFATDFSPSSLHALPYATDLAKQNLTLLHVVCTDVASAEYGSTTLDPAQFAEARARLSSIVPQDSDPDLIVGEGIPALVIVGVARRDNASLIVMGVNPHSAFAATHLPWATAHRVICDAHCPVLTVR